MRKVKNPIKPIILFSTILLISLIALSRMYLGVHFFSDVVGGIIFGIICEIAVITTIRNNFSEKI
jgi:undecaprenyl-diphosphatase